MQCHGVQESQHRSLSCTRVTAGGCSDNCTINGRSEVGGEFRVLLILRSAE